MLVSTVRSVIMSEANLVGGSEADRKQVHDQFKLYLEANSKFDWDTLRDKIWSSAPEATFFNLNGHTYNGRDHWIRLWKYYVQNVASSYWTPFDIGGVVTGDLGVVWFPRKTRRQWTGKEPPRK